MIKILPKNRYNGLIKLTKCSAQLKLNFTFKLSKYQYPNHVAINIIQIIVFYLKESTDFAHNLCQTKI